jgi:Flp pilus assembly protein CpaB
MWKVTRMNTARIVVLIIALGVGSVAAYHPGGSDSRPAPSAGPVAQRQAVDVPTAAGQAGTLSLTLRGITDINQVQLGADDRSLRLGSINVVRDGVSHPATIQT